MNAKVLMHQMIYLLMPDRFANGNTKMIVMQLPPKNTIGNFLVGHGGDIKASSLI
jgi:hypothetical protein